MSSIKSQDMLRRQLNKASPIANDVRLGDLLVALTNAVNYTVAAVLTKAGLVIKAGASPIVKAASAIVANVGGTFVYKAAATDMAALAGTLATGSSAAWAFYIDAAGTLTSAKFADAASVSAALALVTPPGTGLAMIGIAVVSNASGAPFVGGTTALDAGSVTVLYVDITSSVPGVAALGDLTTRAP